MSCGCNNESSNCEHSCHKSSCQKQLSDANKAILDAACILFNYIDKYDCDDDEKDDCDDSHCFDDDKHDCGCDRCLDDDNCDCSCCLDDDDCGCKHRRHRCSNNDDCNCGCNNFFDSREKLEIIARKNRHSCSCWGR